MTEGERPKTWLSQWPEVGLERPVKPVAHFLTTGNLQEGRHRVDRQRKLQLCPLDGLTLGRQVHVRHRHLTDMLTLDDQLSLNLGQTYCNGIWIAHREFEVYESGCRLPQHGQRQARESNVLDLQAGRLDDLLRRATSCQHQSQRKEKLLHASKI